jgi:hypothetical protein
MNMKGKKKESATPSTPPTARNTRWGEWGKVDSQHTDNTVDVLLDSGVFLENVPVACKNWFVLKVDTEKEFNAGERDIPPVNARVFIFMPSYSFDDCFVAPFSGIYTSNADEAEPFIEEGKQKIRERINPSGWHITNDYVTGSYKAESPDKKTSLEIDFGNEEEPKEENPELHLNIFDNVKADITAEKKCTITAFDTEIVIEKGKVLIKPKETTIEVDGNAKIVATKNVDVKGVNVTVEASTMLTLKTGDAAAFCPNIMPVCPLGPTHGGKPAGIVKLVGA